MYFDQVVFGQRIKALRKKHGMTLYQMADELDISFEHYRRIEKGQHGCSIELLIDISEFFNVSTDYLLTGKSFESLYIRKKLSEAQEILLSIQESLPNS